MKINEKNLCMFATTPPVDLEGWLHKRGEINKNWQRRWFLLKGNLLFYFERKGDREPIGMIILEGCTVELSEEGEQYCFQIMFHGANNRTYYLSTESQSNMEQWMKALTCAGYDYMKLMVAELQRQLDEIEECREKIPETASLPPPKAPPRRQNPFNRSQPVEYGSTTASDRSDIVSPMAAPSVSPKLMRKAPPLPTASLAAATSQLTNVEHYPATGKELLPKQTAQTFSCDNSTTAHQLASSGEAVRSQQNAEIKKPNTDLPLHESEELTFEAMHTLFGVPVLADLRARKIAMEKSEQPLIML